MVFALTCSNRLQTVQKHTGQALTQFPQPVHFMNKLNLSSFDKNSESSFSLVDSHQLIYPAN